MTTEEADEFLTVAQIAEQFKVNQQTVRNWISDGELEAHWLGRRVRILRSEVDRFVEAGRSSTRPRPRYAVRYAVLELRERGDGIDYERAVGPFQSRARADEWVDDASKVDLQHVVVPLEKPT
jgi:excisionase family DNA binding protein